LPRLLLLLFGDGPTYNNLKKHKISLEEIKEKNIFPKKKNVAI